MSGVATNNRSTAVIYTSASSTTIANRKRIASNGVATSTRTGASIGCAVANPKRRSPRRSLRR
jgi:hypothetical protein